MIDLNDKTPNIDVKIGEKVYKVYADDKNFKLINGIADRYFEQSKKIEDLIKKAETAEKEGVELKKDEVTNFAENLITDLRGSMFKMLDQLLDEPGIGKKLWEVKHESTEYLMNSVEYIQKSLEEARKDYSKRQAGRLKQLYPTRTAKKRK